MCSGRPSAPYQTDRSSQATRKWQDRRAGAWYRIFYHKPHRRREKQRFLQICYGRAGRNYRHKYSTPYGTRRDVVKLWSCEVVLQIQIPVSQGQSPAHCRRAPPAKVHDATTCLPTATTESEDPKSLGRRCVIVEAAEAAEAAPYCRLASPA